MSDNVGETGPLYATVSFVTRMVDDSKKGYHHRQDVPSSRWEIWHSLGVVPSAIMILDSANNQVFGTVKEVSEELLVVEFSSPFSGQARVK